MVSEDLGLTLSRKGILGNEFELTELEIVGVIILSR